jgi:hypothetical protein
MLVCVHTREDSGAIRPGGGPRPGCKFEPRFFGTRVLLLLGNLAFSINYQMFILKQTSEFIQYFRDIWSNFLKNAIWIMQDAHQIIILKRGTKTKELF